MSKTMATIDMHITYRCHMLTVTGGTCRKRRLHLTRARFAKTKALDSQTQSADSSGVRRYDSGRRTQVIRRESLGVPLSCHRKVRSQSAESFGYMYSDPPCGRRHQRLHLPYWSRLSSHDPKRASRFNLYWRVRNDSIFVVGDDSLMLLGFV